MLEVFIGIGSNLGDRQANILSALQRLRGKARVLKVSAFYESKAAGGAEGPDYLNVAAHLQTDLNEAEFRGLFDRIEAFVGRASKLKSLARSIDIDLLAVDGAIVQPFLDDRPYNATPLFEIAPWLGSAPQKNGMHRLARSLHFAVDRQEEEPKVALSLNRVGVSGIRRTFQLRIDGQARAFSGEFSMAADLAPDKAGVHMSRFSELLEEAALDVLSHDAGASRIEHIVEAIAIKIVESQRALRAEVKLRGTFCLERWTPVSGQRSEESYTLVAIASSDKRGTRRAIGVEAEGMTACPCAQAMIRERSLHELRDAGFNEEDSRRALDALPIATHNQRGRGSLLLGPGEGTVELPRPEDLIEIVENSMSSETYDLLKRPDELFVVNKAHQNPRFVEDVVREILAGALNMFQDFGDDTFVSASQINYESIHKHDAFAEAFGRFGELRQELISGGHCASRTDLSSWLNASAR